MKIFFQFFMSRNYLTVTIGTTDYKVSVTNKLVESDCYLPNSNQGVQNNFQIKHFRNATICSSQR